VDFFKKIFQLGQKNDGPRLENPLGLSNELIDTYSKAIEPVAQVDPALAADLLRFVVDDSDEQCLLKLRGNAAAAEKMGYGPQVYLLQSDPSINRQRVFHAKHRAPAEVCIRYCRVLEAASHDHYGYRGILSAGSPDWLVILLTEACHCYSYLKSKEPQAPPQWTITELEKILAAGGLPEDILVKLSLNQQWKYLFRSYRFDAYSGTVSNTFSGLREHLEKHSKTVKSCLMASDAEERKYALEILSELSFNFKEMPEVLVAYGTGSSKTVREQVLPLLSAYKEFYRSHIEKVLKEGGASERNEATTLLWRLYGEECTDTLESHLATEKADRVRQTIEKYLAAPKAVAAEEPLKVCEVNIDLEPHDLPTEVRSQFKKYMEDGYKLALKFFEGQCKLYDEQRKQIPNLPQPEKPVPLTQSEFDQIVKFIEGKDNSNPFPLSIKTQQWSHTFPAVMGEHLAPPAVTLSHIVRFMYFLRMLNVNAYGTNERVWLQHNNILEPYRERCGNTFGLREFDAAAATLPDLKAGLVSSTYLLSNTWSNFCDWEPEAIWPAFAERPELIERALSTTTGSIYDGNRSTAYKVLAMFPTLPARFIPLVWDQALAESKSDRRLAQDALNTVPGKVEKIIGSLSDGKANVRSAAAEWLGRLGDKSAIEPLKKAFLKEKGESTRGVIIQALDNLKADVNEFLDRDKLLQEAKAGLAKKLPTGSDWVPLDNLPVLHWQDTGAEIDANITKWWIVQSIQQKSPSCGPILKRYLEMCNPGEAARFARFVLQAWVARDTTTISHEDAKARAQADADRLWAQYSTHKWFLDAHKNDKSNVFKAQYDNYMGTCLYSAIEQKGMLAIVSAAGDTDCVKIAEQYIRKWYGNRAAQCKALIEVLSRISQPLALQTLLSIANRFRTKSIKELATTFVNSVAEQRGWTLDELADRTVPDAGFERPVDENGEPINDRCILELDYGARQFVVSLNGQLEPGVTAKGDSKTIKALPEPGKNDDPELAKAAKKEFTDAKKVVKEVVKRQTERLYEALCTQRQWKFEDWREYLAEHPIVGRLCVRLAWVAFEPPKAEGAEQEKLIGVFRPLEDGSLTNEQDEAVDIPADAIVKLAHSCNISKELADAWTKHFQDYDVTPLFEQGNRQVYDLPPEKVKETDVKDFVGYLISTFKLRGRAVKLGYVRGEAEDGGCFCVYRKNFTSLNMQAVIEFTGSYLPESDIPAALRELYFVSTAGNANNSVWSQTKIVLSKVPPVLLSECYNDMKRIAADGSGFDPKWEEKSRF